jgi:hypothetical protein
MRRVNNPCIWRGVILQIGDLSWRQCPRPDKVRLEWGEWVKK